MIITKPMMMLISLRRMLWRSSIMMMLVTINTLLLTDHYQINALTGSHRQRQPRRQPQPTRHSYSSYLDHHQHHLNNETTTQLFIAQLDLNGNKKNDKNDDDTHDEHYYYRLDPPVVLEDEQDDDDDEDENDGEVHHHQPEQTTMGIFHLHHNDEMTTMAWLESATQKILDAQNYNNNTTTPRRRRFLTAYELEQIDSLIALWPRQASITAAKMVEALLKRIVDDMRAGSKRAQITTQHYVHAISAWGKSMNQGSSTSQHHSLFATQRAMSIHEHMIQTYQMTKDPYIRPNRASFHAVLRCIRDPQVAERIFWHDMIQQCQVTPDVHTCAIMLEIYAKAIASTIVTPNTQNNSNNTNNNNDNNKVQHWVQQAEHLFASMPTTLKIRRNPYTFLALQTVYAKARQVKPCLALLEYMQTELYQNRGEVFAKPTCSHYNAVLQALLSPQIQYEDAQFAHQFLTRMETPVEQGGYDVEPDRLSYAMTILICARCCQQQAAIITSNNNDYPSSNNTFNNNKHNNHTTTITAMDKILQCAEWAEFNLERLERRAAAELQKRHRIANHAAPPGVTMDVEMFNPCLTCLSRIARFDPAAPRRILRILHRMQKHAQSGHTAVQPNIRSWNAVLNAFARVSGTHHDRGYARKAEKILHHLWRLHKQGVPNIKPDPFAYAGVLTAYQRSHDSDAAQRADALVFQMEELFEIGMLEAPPDTYHYTILCGTWAKSGQRMAAKRALQILNHMADRANAGFVDVKPNTRTYNAVLDCLSRVGEVERAEELLYFMLKQFRDGNKDAKPDCFSFNCVIQGFTKSNLYKDGGRRAEMVLQRMHEYHEEENSAVQPEARSYNLLLAYYSRSREPDAPYRADYLLNQMVSHFEDGHRELCPSTFAFASVIEKYAKVHHPDAGHNGDRLLKLVRTLNSKYGASSLIVDTNLMNSVIFAWASCGDENAAEKAELYLDEMESAYNNGLVAMRPNTKTYWTVLSAWAKSSCPEKFRRALTILRRMELQQKEGNQDVSVDEHARSLVINACGFSNTYSDADYEAFIVACTMFEEIIEANTSKYPSSLTFAWFIQSCGRLRVPESEKHVQIERAFRLCCKAGRVNEFVMHRLRGATTESFYQKLLGTSYSAQDPMLRKRSTMKYVPASWTRNASGSR